MRSQWSVRQFRQRCPKPSPSSCWCGCTLRDDGVGRIRCRTRPRPPEGDGCLFWPSTDHRCPSAISKDFFLAEAGKDARGRISPDRRLCLRSRARHTAKSRRSTTRPSSLLGTTDRIPCCPESARPLWAAYLTWNLNIGLRSFCVPGPSDRRRKVRTWLLGVAPSGHRGLHSSECVRPGIGQTGRLHEVAPLDLLLQLHQSDVVVRAGRRVRRMHHHSADRNDLLPFGDVESGVVLGYRHEELGCRFTEIDLESDNPLTAWWDEAIYSWTQWAAVSTQFLLTRVPPQKCDPRSLNDTIHGNSPTNVSTPLTMRISRLSEVFCCPQSTSATAKESTVRIPSVETEKLLYD